MKFGFLAHPVDRGQRSQVRAMTFLSGLVAERSGWKRTEGETVSQLPLFTTVRSATGAECTGDVRYVPYTAEELIGRPGAAARFVVEQVQRLAEDGAQLVGLGGATSIVGNRGLATAQQAGVPVTSGNSLTAYAACALLQSVMEHLVAEPAQSEVCIVGFPGAVATAVGQLLLPTGCRLHLVCRKGRLRSADLGSDLPPDACSRITLTDDLPDALRSHRLIVAASSTGGLIDPAELLPGTVVIDVALPRDVRQQSRPRDDVVVLDGGLVTADNRVTVDGLMVGAASQLNGCLAETMVLALEGRAVSLSLGRSLDPAAVTEVGRTARRHGFEPAPPTDHGRTVRWERIERLTQWHPSTPARQPDPAAEARHRFARHINPPQASLYAAHSMDRVFTQAHGATLITPNGTEYLDFVAGFGSLNLGHNHPAPTRALREFLDRQTPTFVQYTSIPSVTAELAEKLCAVAPGPIERVFFSNSGTEAVEAALKLARSATGRRKLVYAENSYHGKTLGSLSVTGRSDHRRGVEPLLPDCLAVPYGDESALTSALDGAAAFIVEPIQGEGGVNIPPPGYLAAAAHLCQEAGALLIVDEIQTGLGRTGRLFACDHDEVQPDILCLAKSLSGGLVPIGATLSKADVWDAAYGTTTGSLLHTSTFGGGNLASAVALATLRALTEEDLPSRAAQLGERIRSGLRDTCTPYEFIADIRGVGMMNAIQFDGRFEGALAALAQDLLTRLPGDLHGLADTLPDDVRTALNTASSLTEKALTDLLCLRYVATMNREHQILTSVTANSNSIVRIQPPLVLTESEADRFISATHLACEAMNAALPQ
ncbi:aminotransferase class III-fold pyridoxal phosphate-dependent enzyme [Streptomyces sp. NY05-11A]|uniref:aminotransferase class III-fold pyridoxal phosphate-dependent enzyme n=1 Tax=Streptomyces soliscabiei TaxID=588897 RepID=UPI0029B813BD|nr:aminotransferase class III-fold pyridoxal phosphate-dependent enzyme [Streptomyces sp. NY05-11A]MDX2679223.1 aminotransferase class III-fold pyridoxal phosphate-dependent enzyme [Streptomyces sp. NY05-11A]